MFTRKLITLLSFEVNINMAISKVLGIKIKLSSFPSSLNFFGIIIICNGGGQEVYDQLFYRL